MTSKLKLILPFIILAIIICAVLGKIYSGPKFDIHATIKEVNALKNGDISLYVGDIYYNYGGAESELTLIVPKELAEGRSGLIVGFGIVCNYKSENGVNTVTKIY